MYPPILKSKVRILRPVEYHYLVEAANTQDNRGRIEGLLYTGLRYVEAQRFQLNPSWLDERGFVFLPKEAVLKSKRYQLERWVKLKPQGVQAARTFLRCKRLPSWEG
jgi:hypothetical protein